MEPETGKKKAKKLTSKQRKIVKAVSEGKTQRQAAKIADASETYVSEILKKPEVIETLNEMMKKHGLDDASLLSVHAEMIQATKVISAIGGKDAGASSVDFIDVPDWQARAKGLEMAYRMKGAFIDKQEIKHSGGIIHKVERVVVRPK